jgi:dynein heavy chain
MDITNNLFPGIKSPESNHGVLVDAIKRTMLKKNLQPSDASILKIVQLYEIKNYRRSVIIIGHSGAAKSTTWKTLRDTLVLLNREQINKFETVIVCRISIVIIIHDKIILKIYFYVLHFYH